MSLYPREVTSEELTLMRSSNQYSRIRAVFFPQPEVFRALVSTAYTSNDSISEISYSDVSAGDYTRIVTGMTMYVYGLSGEFVGMVRAKSATADKVVFGRCSDIVWQIGYTISVVEDFGLWSKLPLLPDENTILMDDDVPYVNQNVNMKPIPIMGSDKVISISSGSVVLDGTDSYTVDDSTISGYNWQIHDTSSGSMILESTSGSVSFVAPSSGLYRSTLTVTSSNGESYTGRRMIYVYDEELYKPLDQLILLGMSSSVADAGWKASIQLWEGTSGSQIRDRAKVALISEDYYSGSPCSIGQISGQEHVLMIGCIDGDTIEYDRETSTIRFDLQGNKYWIEKLPQPSTSLATISPEVDDTEEDTNNWLFYNSLTVNKMVHHFCVWRSTIAEVMDVYPSDQTLLIPGISAGIGNIWGQLNTTIQSRMLMRMGVDRYNRLFVIQDVQLRQAWDRGEIPTVVSLTDDDFGDKVTIKRNVSSMVSMVVVSALIGVQTDVIAMSRAPGSLVYKRFGEQKTYDRCVVDNQETANYLSGNLLAKLNNEYPDVTVTLAENNRMVDIVPAMYVSMSISSSQNIRGISFTNKKFLIKSIEYYIDPDKGYFTSEMSLEAETLGVPGVTVDMPPEPIYNFPPQPVIPLVPIPLYPIPSFTFPNISQFLPRPALPVSGSSSDLCYDLMVKQATYYTTDTIRHIVPFKCKILPNTYYQLSGQFQKYASAGTSGSAWGQGIYNYTDDDAFYSIKGLNSSGSPVCSFTKYPVSGSGVSGSGVDGYSVRSGYYSGSASVDVEYLEIDMELEPPMVATDVALTVSADYDEPLATPILTWGLSPTGIAIRVQDIFRWQHYHPAAFCSCSFLLTITGAGGSNWYKKLMRMRWSSKKIKPDSSGVMTGYALHAYTGTTPIADPWIETTTVSGNWSEYQVGINQQLSVSDFVGRDRRTTQITASGSSAVPVDWYFDTDKNSDYAKIQIERSCYISDYRYTRELDFNILIEPVPLYRLVMTRLLICNVNQVTLEAPTLPVDVGIE